VTTVWHISQTILKHNFKKINLQRKIRTQNCYNLFSLKSAIRYINLHEPKLEFPIWKQPQRVTALVASHIKSLVCDGKPYSCDQI
jgi:hypothetical protein